MSTPFIVILRVGIRGRSDPSAHGFLDGIPQFQPAWEARVLNATKKTLSTSTESDFREPVFRRSACDRRIRSLRDRKRFCDASLNARTAIRQIRAAGEPFQGTVLPRSRPRGNAVFQRGNERSNCISHRAPPKRSCA
jgi:hypothetical protein